MIRFVVSDTYQHMLTGEAVVRYITLDCDVPALEAAMTAEKCDRRFVGMEVRPDAD